MIIRKNGDKESQYKTREDEKGMKKIEQELICAKDMRNIINK